MVRRQPTKPEAGRCLGTQSLTIRSAQPERTRRLAHPQFESFFVQWSLGIELRLIIPPSTSVSVKFSPHSRRAGTACGHAAPLLAALHGFFSASQRLGQHRACTIFV